MQQLCTELDVNHHEMRKKVCLGATSFLTTATTCLTWVHCLTVRMLAQHVAMSCRDLAICHGTQAVPLMDAYITLNCCSRQPVLDVIEHECQVE